MTTELRDLDRYVERLQRRAKTPGISLGLLRRGRSPYARGYGFRDREHELPATSKTIYGIASVTKSFTALAMLRLAEDRRLRLSDPVTRHLPELQVPGASARRPMRLHHFLSHSSGLPPLPSIYYTSMRSLRRDPPYDPRVARRVGIDPDHAPIDTYPDLMRYLSETNYRTLGPPGAVFSYSNEGFGLLGAVIERASGRTYESFVEEEILRPAGMRSTSFDTGILFRQPEVTTLYSPRWTGKRHPLVPSEEWWDDTSLRAAGALRTNVEDLLRYLQIYLHQGRVDGERVVEASSVEEVVRPRISVDNGCYYAYGLAVQPDHRGHVVVFHSGGLKGVASQVAVVPRSGVAAAALSNADNGPAVPVVTAAVNHALGLPLNQSFAHLPRPTPTTASLRPYAGWYCSGEGIWAHVRARRHDLVLDFRGIEAVARNLRLRPAGPDTFLAREQGQSASFRFLRDPSGRVVGAFIGWRVVRRRTPAELPRAARGTIVW